MRQSYGVTAILSLSNLHHAKFQILLVITCFLLCQETWLLSKERELKEHVRKDRDKEIELVITRLEDDAATAREECERAAENRVK